MATYNIVLLKIDHLFELETYRYHFFETDTDILEVKYRPIISMGRYYLASLIIVKLEFAYWQYSKVNVGR